MQFGIWSKNIVTCVHVSCKNVPGISLVYQPEKVLQHWLPVGILQRLKPPLGHNSHISPIQDEQYTANTLIQARVPNTFREGIKWHFRTSYYNFMRFHSGWISRTSVPVINDFINAWRAPAAALFTLQDTRVLSPVGENWIHLCRWVTWTCLSRILGLKIGRVTKQGS